MTDAPSAAGAPSTVLSSQFIRTLLTRSPYRDRLRGTRVAIEGARFQETLLLDNISVDIALFLTDCRFDEGIDMQASRFSHTISLSRSTVGKPLNLQGLEVGGSLFLGRSDEAHPRTSLHSVFALGASVAGALSIVDADVSETIDLSMVRVKGPISLVGTKAKRVALVAAEIAGQTIVVDVELSGNGTEPGLALNMYSLRAAQNVFLNRSKFHAEILAEDADIKGSMILTGATLRSLNLRGGSIRNAFVVGRNIITESDSNLALDTTWESGAAIDLENTDIGVISTPPSLKYWPQKIALTNANFRSFDFVKEERAPTSQEKEAWIRGWLGRQEPYVASPYAQTTTVLRRQGEATVASAVGFAGKNRELGATLSEWPSPNAILYTILLFFSLATIGYGYHWWITVVWTSIFVIVGALLFRRTEEAKAKGMPYGFVFSFDHFLPLINLREQNSKIEIAGWLRYYFYFHRLAGWVLGSFIVAGLSGVTK